MESVKHLKIPLQEINLATGNFSDENLIGIGGFGKVYAAKLSLSGQQRTFALKRLNSTSEQGEREFLMEIQLLSCYRHKNLVTLVGFCEESGEMILVYEYAENGSLDKYICKTDLSWVQRLKISIGAARGFNYLHNDVGPQHRVLHRDIKSSNILLDENWEAKISDFGLSKIGPSNVEFTFLLTKVCGTPGYVDPEYYRTGKLTKESDVYSFGVVLFEILCGRLACTKFQDQTQFLSSLAPKCYEENRLAEIIDPDLKTQINVDSMDMFSMVAYQCLKENSIERPTMGWVVEKLEKALELQAGSKVPRLIRIGTWGRESGGPQEYWSFELEKDTRLWKIRIDHSEAIYSLTFTTKSESRDFLQTTKKVGGWASGNKDFKVTNETRGFFQRKFLGWTSGHKVSEVTFDVDEEIIGINGTIGSVVDYKTISSLSFVTNKRTYGPFGKETKTQFSVPWEGGSLVGFYGFAGHYIDTIGVYVKAYDEIIKVGTWGKTQGVGPQNQWSFRIKKNHHLKKINVNHGDLIYSLMFTTEHRGVLQNSKQAGGWKLGEIASEVWFDWDEEIQAMSGTVELSRGDDPGCIVITSISFVTNKRTHGPFGNERGKPFTVSWDDCSYVGFYGAAGWYIDKIGVYLKTTT